MQCIPRSGPRVLRPGVLAGLIAVGLYVTSANAPAIAEHPPQCYNATLSGNFHFSTTNTGVPITRQGTATITVVCLGAVDAGGVNPGPTFEWTLQLNTGDHLTDANAKGTGRLVSAGVVVFHGNGTGNTLGRFSIGSRDDRPSTYTVQNGAISDADLHANIHFDSRMEGTGDTNVCPNPGEVGCNSTS